MPKNKTKTLQDMRADHRRYGHHGQAEAVAAELRRRSPTLEIIGPEDAESGRYVAVYVTLVPKLVRMRIYLTYSALNQHSYNLEPVSGDVGDKRQFIAYMKAHHAGIDLKKDGDYAKLPGWARANVKNDNHNVIARHVQEALKVFTGKVPLGSGQ